MLQHEDPLSISVNFDRFCQMLALNMTDFKRINLTTKVSNKEITVLVGCYATARFADVNSRKRHWFLSRRIVDCTPQYVETIALRLPRGKAKTNENDRHSESS